MGDKYSDKVPTVGTKNLSKQKIQEVETASELAPGKSKAGQNTQSKQYKTPKPGEGG